jgi:HK97 gp10 family phage protein
MSETIKISGLNEVKDALLKLNYRLGERVMRLALKKGANYMAKAIKRTAPVKSGRLKKSISIRSSRFAKFTTRGTVGVYILVGGGSLKAAREFAKQKKLAAAPGEKAKTKASAKRAWYAKSIEYGYTARGKKNRFSAGGKATRVRGQHFIQEAQNYTQERSVEIIVDAASRGFVEAAKQANLNVVLK